MKDLPERGMWVSSQIEKPYKSGSRFRNGDTLVARITPCLENGKSAFVNFLSNDELAFGSTEFIVLRPRSKFLKEYVYHLARSEQFRKSAIKSMVGSSGRQRVQLDTVRKYKIAYPTESVLRRFHKAMAPVFGQIKLNSLENKTLSKARDSLLPRLMGGRVRVN